MSTTLALEEHTIKLDYEQPAGTGWTMTSDGEYAYVELAPSPGVEPVDEVDPTKMNPNEVGVATDGLAVACELRKQALHVLALT